MMFTNGDFETGDLTGWSILGSVVAVQEGQEGSWCAKIRGRTTGPFGVLGKLWQEISVTPGATVELTYAIRGYNDTSPFRVQYSEDGGFSWTDLRVFNPGEMPTDFQTYLDSFTPTASPILVQFAVDSGTATTTYYWVDDVVGTEAAVTEEDMALMLGERAVPAMLKTLQTHLATEVTAINLERNDTEVQIAAIQKWYCYERETADPDLNECEVYIPQDGITFPRMAAQTSRWALSTRTNLDSRARVVVAINHANRGGVSGGTLRVSDIWKRSQRYASAIVRTVRNNYELGQTPTGEVFAFPENVRTGVKRSGAEDFRLVDRVEVTFVVEMQESADGENQAAGGVPPACTLES